MSLCNRYFHYFSPLVTLHTQSPIPVYCYSAMKLWSLCLGCLLLTQSTCCCLYIYLLFQHVVEFLFIRYMLLQSSSLWYMYCKRNILSVTHFSRWATESCRVTYIFQRLPCHLNKCLPTSDIWIGDAQRVLWCFSDWLCVSYNYYSCILLCVCWFVDYLHTCIDGLKSSKSVMMIYLYMNRWVSFVWK